MVSTSRLHSFSFFYAIKSFQRSHRIIFSDQDNLVLILIILISGFLISKHDEQSTHPESWNVQCSSLLRKQPSPRVLSAFRDKNSMLWYRKPVVLWFFCAGGMTEIYKHYWSWVLWKKKAQKILQFVQHVLIYNYFDFQIPSGITLPM